MRLLIPILLAVLLAAEQTVTPIDWSALPAAVQTAAKRRKTPADAKVQYVKILRGKETFFEMKVDAGGGYDQEILFRPDGQIVETEEAVPLASIPAPARMAIIRGAAGGDIGKVDRLVRDGKVYFEGEIVKNGVKQKLLFDPEGKRVE